VSALLWSEGLSSSKHTGIRSLFFRDWVNTGRVSSAVGDLYRDLFDRRMEGDYHDMVQFSSEQVERWLGRTQETVEALAILTEQQIVERKDESSS
jgi:uncharacterized protein (UPF0332 family)